MPRTSVPLGPESCRTLLALVDTNGNATLAAQQLNINQASMSKRLKPLQHASEELPRPWVEKKGKRFVLTQEGRQVLPAVKQAVRWWQDFNAYVRNGRPPEVHFACGQEAVGGFVLEAVIAFNRKDRGVDLCVSTLPGPDRIRRVALGLLDLAAVIQEEAMIHKIARRELHVEDLFDDPLQFVCAAQGKWAEPFSQLPENRRVSARDLTKFPLILPDSQSSLRRMFNQMIESEGVLGQLHVPLEPGGWPTVDLYVRKGLGVALLPSSVVARHRGGLLVRELHPSIAPSNVVRLICRKHPLEEGKLDLSEAAQVFRDLLRTEAARLRREEPTTGEKKK